MPQTWPYFYPVSLPAPIPTFQVVGTPITPSSDPNAEAPMGFHRLSIFYPGAGALVPMRALASAVLSFAVAQTEDALPFIHIDKSNITDEVDLEAQMDVGPHTHTLFLHHQVTQAVAKELAPFLQAPEPVPVFVIMTYKGSGNQVLHSYYLGNIVQYSGQHYVPGTAVVQTTCIQCFGVSEFQIPTQPTVEYAFDEMMTWAKVNELQYEDEEDYDHDDHDEDEEGDELEIEDDDA